MPTRGEPKRASMKAPYFTVLIDAYNYGEYIEEAVSSALAQDFPFEEREILVVDDGSTDDTQERLRRFGKAIRYLRKPNGGQASAFNFGFANACGQVIALLDADDVWMPEKLERVYEEFERHPAAGMVYHRVHLWNGVSDISEDSYFIPVSGRVTKNRRALLQYPMAGTSCLAFRREALQELLPVPESLRFQADAYLTALVIFVAEVAAVPEFLGKYRLHGANLFQTNAERMAVNQIERKMAVRQMLLEEIWNWLQKHGEDVGSPEIRGYLKQWVKAQESDGFALRAPSRWKYFRHLIDFPWTYGEIMTQRHRVYSYIRAFAALFLGYHHLYVLDDMRVKRKALFAAPPEKREATEKEKALAARG
jgi:glycosyltransferase involved in cell wall biosynthesis